MDIKIRRPIWKEYTLIKYDGKKIISREKIRIDEAKYFPEKGDLVLEQKLKTELEMAA